MRKIRTLITTIIAMVGLCIFVSCGDKNTSSTGTNNETTPVVSTPVQSTPGTSTPSQVVSTPTTSTPISSVVPTTSTMQTTTQIKEKVFVSFECMNGSETQMIEVDETGKLISKPSDPVLKDHMFTGWYIDLENKTEFDFNSVITSSITVYARFVKIHTVTFTTGTDEVFTSLTYTMDDKLTLPIPTKDGFIFDAWEDENGNRYNSIPYGTDTDLNLTAVFRECGPATISYNSLASSFPAGTLTNETNSIFTFNCDVRARIRNWTNPLDSSETASWDMSYKLGSSSSNISFKAPGNGVLTLFVQNGSTSAKTQTITLSGSDGTKVSPSFSGNDAVAPDPAGSPVCKLELTVKKDVTYKITRSSGTVDIFEMRLACEVAELPITGIKVESCGIVDYVEASKYNAFGVSITSIHGDNMYFSDVNIDDAYIDSSAVDMTKPGVYPVVVNLGQFSTSFDVCVYEAFEIELGFNETYEDRNSYNGIYVNGKVQQIYNLGDEFNPEHLTVTVHSKLNDKSQNFISGDYISFAGFDSQTPGLKTITVTWNGNGRNLKASYNVYVVDTNPYKDSNGNYVVTVDKSYTGEIGSVYGTKGNMFTAIGQALEYLQNENIDANTQKILNISAGLYQEKIEITIPNLTIIGQGTCKATESTNENYNENEYNLATIIEWNSLYGIPDESGYSQVTDSTATVAIREEAINCVIKNVTISNYWNCEEVFQNNIDYLTEMGIAVSGKVNDHRALALIVQADKFIMTDCVLLGYQDTVEFMTGRQYVYNTFIAGNTDFIFGTNATTYFKNCQIHIAYKIGGGGYITAYKGCNSGSTDYVDYGFIFDSCKFTADKGVGVGSFAIGRCWGSYSTVMTMNCELGSHIANGSGTRYMSMGGINPTDEHVRYYEYNNTGNGAISQAVDGVKLVDEAFASNFSKFEVIFASKNGAFTYGDSWIPTF